MSDKAPPRRWQIIPSLRWHQLIGRHTVTDRRRVGGPDMQGRVLIEATCSCGCTVREVR